MKDEVLFDLNKFGSKGVELAQLAGTTEPVGQVETASGLITARHLNGGSSTLTEGSNIFSGDTLEVANEGSVGIIFADETTLSLGSGAQMMIDEFVYDPSSEEGNIAVQISQGIFSFVSGEISKTADNAMTINTPIATIGIRGTKGAGLAAPEGQENRITLMAEEDGQVGELIVSNDNGVQVLNQPGMSLAFNSRFEAPPPPQLMSTADIQNTYESALKALPASSKRSTDNRNNSNEDENSNSVAATGEEGEVSSQGENGDAKEVVEEALAQSGAFEGNPEAIVAAKEAYEAALANGATLEEAVSSAMAAGQAVMNVSAREEVTDALLAQISQTIDGEAVERTAVFGPRPSGGSLESNNHEARVFNEETTSRETSDGSLGAKTNPLEKEQDLLQTLTLEPQADLQARPATLETLFVPATTTNRPKVPETAAPTATPVESQTVINLVNSTDQTAGDLFKALDLYNDETLKQINWTQVYNHALTDNTQSAQDLDVLQSLSEGMQNTTLQTTSFEKLRAQMNNDVSEGLSQYVSNSTEAIMLLSAITDATLNNFDWSGLYQDMKNHGAISPVVDQALSSLSSNDLAQQNTGLEQIITVLQSYQASTPLNDVEDLLRLYSEPPIVSGTVAFLMDEDTTLTFLSSELLPNASDLENDPLSVVNVSAQNGVVTDNNDGTWTFTPDTDFNGEAQLSYGVSDGTNITNATGLITIDPVADAVSISGPISLNTKKDTALTFSKDELLAHVSNGDGRDLSILNLEANDGLLINNGNDTWTFYPDSGFAGEIDLSYDVFDGIIGVSTAGTISIDNSSPIATDTPVFRFSNASVFLIKEADILASISDPDGDSFTITDMSVDGGLIVDNGDATWTYQATAGFTGDITLSISVSDGVATSVITTTLSALNTISGTSASEQVFGTTGDEAILAGDGDDWIVGESGDDLIDGGAGNDVLYGDAPLIGRVSTDQSGLEISWGISSGSDLELESGSFLFTTDAGLDALDTNALQDVYVKDIDSTTNTITLISKKADGSTSTVASGTDLGLSGDGNYAFFTSTATDLMATSVDATTQIFRYDLQTNTMLLVSTASDNTTEGNQTSRMLDASSDGNLMLFTSAASNLGPTDSNSNQDVFLKNISTGTVTLISKNSSGTDSAINGSYAGSFSDDGQHIVFTSSATDIIAGDANGFSDIFIHDIAAGTTELVSVDTADNQSDANSTLGDISSNGRYVVFTTTATNLDGTDALTNYDVFVRDTVAGTTSKVTAASGGGETDGDSSDPSISDDGKFVAFSSAATNLMSQTDATAASYDVYIKNMETGEVRGLNKPLGGDLTGTSSSSPQISADGQTVIFTSNGVLVPGDANNASDAYIAQNPFFSDTTGGKDMLNGGTGDDTLWGGGGDDMLTGGDGADTFYFQYGDGTDTITDFTSGTDKIVLDTASFGIVAADSGQFTFETMTTTFDGSNATADSSNVILDGDSNLYVDTNGAKTAGGYSIVAHLESGTIAASDIDSAD